MALEWGNFMNQRMNPVYKYKKYQQERVTSTPVYEITQNSIDHA